jgi:hypothetical protein
MTEFEGPPRMPELLRLRQICLVSKSLRPVVADIEFIMGLQVCYNDPNVGRYGLENALMPVSTTFLEVVAPVRDGTSAGRFLEKSQGHGGYMICFSASDTERRRDYVRSIGIRIANIIDRNGMYDIQLHPKDCRVSFIDFGYTHGSDEIMGPHAAAGPNWQRAIRTDTTQALIGLEIESPDPASLARHMAKIIEVPVDSENGSPQLTFDNCRFSYMRGPSDGLGGLLFQVTDASRVLGRARDRGYDTTGDCFHIAGVRFRPIELH